jgi:hypothetical protein
MSTAKADRILSDNQLEIVAAHFKLLAEPM